MGFMAEANKRDIQKLEKWLDVVGKYTRWNVDDIIMETMRFSLQSARLATKPKSKSKELPQKYTVRPLVVMPSSMGYWYTQKGKNKPFKVKRQLNRKEVSRKGLVRVKKGIKIWKKGRGWVYRPWAGKKQKRNKAFIIPHAGLARDAWGWLIPKFPSSRGKTPKAKVSKRNMNTPNIASARRNALLAEAVNKVEYAYKANPFSARIGLRKGINRVMGRRREQLEKAIERKFNR